MDISAVRLAFVFRWNRTRALKQLLDEWPADGPTVPAMSVRSGLHLILGQLDWPEGSEVLMSAMTIPDMARIVRHHGYVPVPVDLDLDTAAPTLESLEQATTHHTRGLIVAHLFGTRIDLSHILSFASERGIAVLEDCAQAFVGPDWKGTPGCMASMFSFGTIKTSTAFGGAILTIRDPDLAVATIQAHDKWPVQHRVSYGFRIARAVLIQILSYRAIFAVFRFCCRILRRDYDHILNNFVRGFPGDHLIQQIEQQPGTPLLVLLRRRILRFDATHLARRVMLGERLRDTTHTTPGLLGHRGNNHTFWIFPILAQRPRELISRLRLEGFDATRGASMEIVAPPEGRPDTAPTIRTAFDRIVYLPLYPDMSEEAVDRLGRVVCEAESQNQ